LDLILSLDEELPKDIFTLSHPVMIFSGSPDFLTGVYQSIKLEKYLKNAFRINFTMGSHWLILEWPELIAEYVLDFLLFRDEKLKLLSPKHKTKQVIENDKIMEKNKEE
jgi:pimeloyl-ACP methyl ester carboxylesterase